MTQEVVTTGGSILTFITNPATAAIVSAIIGFLFNMWRIQPSKKLQLSFKLITEFAPIIFRALEEAAEAAKKNTDHPEVIDKAMRYEQEIRKILELYGGVVNDQIIAYAKTYAKAINYDYKLAQSDERCGTEKLLSLSPIPKA